MSLSPRLIAIQGVEFTPIQIAVQGLLDYIGSGGRVGGRAGASIKLVKFREGKSYLEHSKSLSRSNRVTARGEVVLPQPPLEIPGHITASHSKCTSRAGKMRSSAGATSKAKRSLQVVLAHAVKARGVAVSNLRPSKNLSLYGEIWVSAGAKTTPLNSRNISNFERVRARGVRNLSDVELVAIVRATIDKRN